jgi:hypothetical protein
VSFNFAQKEKCFILTNESLLIYELDTLDLIGAFCYFTNFGWNYCVSLSAPDSNRLADVQNIQADQAKNPASAKRHSRKKPKLRFAPCPLLKMSEMDPARQRGKAEIKLFLFT